MKKALITQVVVSTTHPDGGQISLIVGACPFCGKTHRHGGGNDLAGLQGYLGSRVSHCHRGEYLLVMGGGQ